MDRKERCRLRLGAYSNWRIEGAAHREDRSSQRSEEDQESLVSRKPSEESRFCMITTKCQLLSLSFLICEMGIIRVGDSQRCCKDSSRCGKGSTGLASARSVPAAVSLGVVHCSTVQGQPHHEFASDTLPPFSDPQPSHFPLTRRNACREPGYPSPTH